MALSSATRRTAHRAGRDGLLRLFGALGVIAGLLWALDRPQATPPASCRPHAAEVAGTCFSEALRASVLPPVIAIGIGAILGLLIGALVARLVTGPARR